MKRLWERPVIRKATAVVLFLAAVALQVFFKNLPWPLRLEDTEKLKNLAVAEGSQEIVLRNAKMRSMHTLLSYRGNAWEALDVDVTPARLDEQSTGFLSLSHSGRPPADPVSWAYVTQERGPSIGEPCRTFLDVTVEPETDAGSEFHLSFHLSQRESDSLRRLEIKSDTTPLRVRLLTSPPDPDKLNGPLCTKTLQGAAWQEKIRNVPLMFVTEPRSNIRVVFIAESDKSTWGQDGLFRSAEFGPILAQSVTVRKVQEDGTVEKAPPVLHFRAFRHQPIALNHLTLGSDLLRLNATGRAWVWQDGKPMGFDVIDAMQKNLEFSALLLGANGLFLAWLRKLFFGDNRERPTEEAAPDLKPPND